MVTQQVMSPILVLSSYSTWNQYPPQQ